MISESKTITMINELLPTSVQKISNCYESDSEVFKLDNSELLCTIDEFSAEDLFRENDPFTLGWNIATGALSDIYASAGKPLFYSHALVVKQDWNQKYIKEFIKGIAAVLSETDISFLAGDFGVSKDWHYTASIIGKPITKPITRIGAKAGDCIYISGKIGLGNFEAALDLYKNKNAISALTNRINYRFAIRSQEAKLISKFATSCIDTSDGVLNGIHTIAHLNKVGFEIESLPYIKQGKLISKLLKLPIELLFMGECGEYELLFTVDTQHENNLLSKANKEGLKFYKIGKIIIDEEKQILKTKKELFNFNDFNLSAREFPNVKDYLVRLNSWLQTNSTQLGEQ